MASLFIMTSIVLTGRIEILFFYLFFVAVLYRAAKLTWDLMTRTLRPFLWLLLLTLVLHALMTPGQRIFAFPVIGLRVTKDGLLFGFFYTMRLAILVMIAGLLTLTTSPMAITDAMTSFFRPLRKFRIPYQDIAMMLSIAIRFIPIFFEESVRIKNAQISRGLNLQGNIRRRIRSVIPFLVPLFLSAFRKANELALAMDARCYRGGDRRTSYTILKFKTADLVAFLIVILSCSPSFFIR